MATENFTTKPFTLNILSEGSWIDAAEPDGYND